MRRLSALVVVAALARSVAAEESPQPVHNLYYGPWQLAHIAVDAKSVWASGHSRDGGWALLRIDKRRGTAQVVQRSKDEPALPVEGALDDERVYAIVPQGFAVVSRARRPGRPGDTWLGGELRPARGRSVRIPGGRTVVPCGHHSDCDADVPAFELDAEDVSRRAYLECVAHDACTPPEEYWSDARGPALVDLSRAEEYCRFAGERLSRRFEWDLVVQHGKLRELGLDGEQTVWTDSGTQRAGEPMAEPDGEGHLRCAR